MKWLVNTVIVSICILVTVAGCQKSEAGDQKAQATTKVEVSTLPSTEIKSPVAAAPAVTHAPAAETAAPAPTTVPEVNKPIGEQPKIKFENTVVDLNDMKPGSKNDANYTFTNVGKGDLKIIDIQKTCGCTVPELIKRDYAPGKSGTIKVQYQATKTAGPVLKHLYVLSNDTNNPRVEIVLKGNIVLKVEATPRTMQLSLEAPDANAQDITIYSKDDKPFSIKSVESTNSTVTADIDPNVSATKFVIRPKVDMRKLKTNLNGFIKVNLTHPDIDEITVNYSTMPEFEMQPPAIILRSAIAQQPETRELWVKNNYNKPFEIESVVSKNGFMKELKREKVNNMYKLTIEITPPELQKIMFFNDTMTIKIENEQSLDVVCRGFFKRK